jgi:hypothetical protein
MCDSSLNSEIIKLCQQPRCGTKIVLRIFPGDQPDRPEANNMVSVILWITQLLQFTVSAIKLTDTARMVTCLRAVSESADRLTESKPPSGRRHRTQYRVTHYVIDACASARGNQQFFICRSDSVASSYILTLAFLIMCYFFTHQNKNSNQIKQT